MKRRFLHLTNERWNDFGVFISLYLFLLLSLSSVSLPLRVTMSECNLVFTSLPITERNHVVRTKNKSNWTCYVLSISTRIEIELLHFIHGANSCFVLCLYLSVFLFLFVCLILLNSFVHLLFLLYIFPIHFFVHLLLFLCINISPFVRKRDRKKKPIFQSRISFVWRNCELLVGEMRKCHSHNVMHICAVWQYNSVLSNL